MGLRRRGPRLKARSLALALALPLLGLCSSCGLSKTKQELLNLYQTNSQDFFTKSLYVQAQQQAEQALAIDGNLVGMRIIRAFCLAKLGKAQGSSPKIDRAVEMFEDLCASGGSEDYRVWLGAGEAHLARAMLYDRQIATHERRLASDYLDAAGRDAERQDLEDAQEGRDEQLRQAERAVARAFTFEYVQDIPVALIDMVLVLNSIGGREQEALTLGRRAITQLIQSSALAQTRLQQNLNLTPAHKLQLEERIRDNLSHEQQLRAMLVDIEWNQGHFESALVELDAIDERQLMQAVDYQRRAAIHEQLGHLSLAVIDLQNYLKQRAIERDFDDVATAVYDHIDELVAQGAAPPPP